MGAHTLTQISLKRGFRVPPTAGYICFVLLLLSLLFPNKVQAQAATPTPGEWVTDRIIFTDATSGFPGTPIADAAVFQLSDGRWRMIFDTGGAERSAISPDGLTFTMESGTRFPTVTNEGQGIRPALVKVLKLATGEIRAYFSSGPTMYSAISSDGGFTFTMENGVRISRANFSSDSITGGSVVRSPDGKWKMYFGDADHVYSASSTDLLNWTPDPGVRVGPGSTLGSNPAQHPDAITNADGSITVYFFHAPTPAIPFGDKNGIWSSTSSDGITFQTETFSGIDYFDPNVVPQPNGDLRMYFNKGDNNGGELYVALRGTPTLANISTRANIQTDSNVLIGGFIITGTDSKTVIIRGIGPSLTKFGVSGALQDPTLELHKPDGSVVTNDNWKVDDATGQFSPNPNYGALAPSNDLESALLLTLPPGGYTAIVKGKNGGTGIGLVEVYDIDRGGEAKLANISSRGLVQTADNAIIGGVIIQGQKPEKVVLRAIGPSLANVGVTGVLQDPTLELHDGNGTTLVTNDNWKVNDSTGLSQEAEIRSTNLRPTHDLESAMVQTLNPGNYTAIVRGKNGSTGVAVVEVYRIN